VPGAEILVPAGRRARLKSGGRMNAPSASSSVEIAAPPERVYGLITDLGSMAELAAETSTMTWKKGSSAAPGSVFVGTNDNGKRKWSTTCTVTDADAGHRFAFEVHSVARIPVSRWQYEIEATPTGCRVTESTWDKRPGWFKKPASIATATPDRTGSNAKNIEATLQRLKDRAESA
jgi:uncharacterized protein YndB with AHSA1/START domain